VTHTEKVHVVFGLVAAVIGVLSLWQVFHPRSRAGLVWPLLAFLLGVFLFIPVESQSRTYQEVGWSDTLLSAVPQQPRTWLRDWFHYLPQRHVIQHKLGAMFIMIVGVLELLRGRGRLAGPAWGLTLPILLLAVGVAFGVHGGTAVHLTHVREQFEHHLLGGSLAAGAVTLALVRTGRLQGRLWEGTWPALVLLIGLILILSYRLTPAERTVEVHQHASTGTGLR
jgi:uncharacterized membrane protein HdeD (DUF308 family)